MRKFNKSKVIFYINLTFSLLFILLSIICLTKLNETVIHLGIDLYLVIAITFIVFAIPFTFSVIKYLIMPKIALTINKDEFIIHKRKKDIRIHSWNIIGVSKTNFFNFIEGLDIGTLKIIVKNIDQAIYIRNINDVDKAYQTLNIFILRQYEGINKNI